MTIVEGRPCWFELATAKGQLDAADRFYADVFGWTVTDAGMPGFTYHLAAAAGEMVAGLMEMPEDVGAMPPFWMLYFATSDGDRTLAQVTAEGGSIMRPLAEIPGTGRFAICADPQGLGFGILEPAPMQDGSPGGNAFDPGKPGHGQWIELTSPNPVAGFDFYAAVFGWSRGRAMDMGPMGTYQLIQLDGVDIGGMMAKGDAPAGGWVPYFGVPSIRAAADSIASGGGRILHGPADVPGGAKIVIAADPQSATFAAVGPEQ